MQKGNVYNKQTQALITCNNILYEGGTLDKVLYPIGSIYMSVNSTNPGTLFGGTWTQISGRFLYCTTTSKTTGGSTTTGSTTLTVDQIPSHNHQERLYFHGYSGFSGGSSGNVYVFNWSSENCIVNRNSSNTSSYTQLCNQPDTYNRGGGQGHTHPQNLPPYFTVYCWYRVS